MGAETAEIADLIARCALRDRAAFRDLYRRTSAKLFGVTLRILRDRSEAEEALQEVYVKIWQRADRYVPGGYSPISWLVAVARNHSLDVLRARKPQSEDIDMALDVADAGPDPEKAAADRGERSRIENRQIGVHPLNLPPHLFDERRQWLRATHVNEHRRG